MKKTYKHYIIYLIGLTFLATACEKEQPDFFDSSANGVYFDYEYAADFQQTVNFANYIIGNPGSVPVNLKLKLLGYLSNEERTAYIKTKPVEGYPEAQVEFENVVFEAGTYEKTIEIKVNRPEELNTDYAICLYLDADEPGGIGSGIAGREEYIIYVKEKYEQPSQWTEYSLLQTYLGAWSAEKHIFLINMLEDDNYIDNILSQYNSWELLTNCNQQAVELLRAERDANPGTTITIDIPFRSDCTYEKPTYWGELHNKYLGEYTNIVFANVTSMLGVNTSNEIELLSNESNLAELNKAIVKVMQENYNNYFINWYVGYLSFYQNSYAPMFADVDYELIQPICWNPEGPDGGERVGKYYGEYSEEKYRFMINTWIKKQESEGEQFILWQMFPVVYRSTGTIGWDNESGGLQAIKECYKVFKEAYDAAPAGTYNFTFPNV